MMKELFGMKSFIAFGWHYILSVIFNLPSRFPARAARQNMTMCDDLPLSTIQNKLNSLDGFAHIQNVIIKIRHSRNISRNIFRLPTSCLNCQ